MRALLDEIAAIKTGADVQRAISHLHAIGVDVGFGVAADQDLHDPTTVIAHVTAAGLGLPDRDYYLKTEERFVETRAKYHEHVAKMFVLAGSTPEAAETAATATFEFEKRLAEATLDNVASRDPFQQDHKTRFDGLKAMAPDFDWAATSTPRSCRTVTSTSPSRSSWRPSTRNSRRRRSINGAITSRGTSWIPSPIRCPQPFVEQNFAFYGKYLSGATEMKPRWKRCAEATDDQLGEALGRAYVRSIFRRSPRRAWRRWSGTSCWRCTTRSRAWTG